MSKSRGKTINIFLPEKQLKKQVMAIETDSGNLFIADSNHGEANMNGEIIDIKVNWKNNDTLIIDYDKRARIFKNKPSKSGVNIIYKSH